MITLHGFGENLGVKDPSPLVLKVDAYMRMAGINFRNNNHPNNLQKAPKGKLPFIVDDGKTIADSQFILEYLKESHANLDEHLSKEELALTYLLTKSLDENLYFCLFYSRWMCEDTWKIVKKAFFGKLPPVVRSLVPKIVRKKFVRNLQGQGIGKHSHEEILHITQQSFIALSDLLGDKDYFFGKEPCSFDASAYGILASFAETTIDNEFNQLAKSYTNLVEYCNRIKTNFYS
jgi:glutathione S-transferase